MASPGGREADRVSVRVVPDTSRFAADLRRELTRIEAALSVTIPIDADLDRFNTAVRTRLAALRAESVSVRVEADRDGLDGLRTSLTRLGNDSGSAGGPLAAVTNSVASLRTAAVTALPNVAGLAGGLVQMAPAAAVAATGLLAVVSAGAAIKIGTSGVAKALKGDANAMDRLAPSARAFVTEVQGLKPAWDALRSFVQQALFDGLAASVQRLVTSVLPVLRTQLTATAGALNTMGKGVADAAADLADSGTLGKAMSSANTGLRNLAGVPALVVRGLGQIAAAAGPSFERITSGAASAAQGISDRLTKAFESGGLQKAIEGAVSLVRQLFSTIGNLGTAFGNIFGPASAAGSGFLGILNQVSKTLADVTGTKTAQQAFKGLFETLAAAGRVISGVLGTALKAVVPLISTIVSSLAGPLQNAFSVLGPALESVVSSLGIALGPAVKSLSGLLAGLLPIVAKIAAQAASALGPALEQVGPLLGNIGDTLSAILMPILGQLPAILQPILSAAGMLVGILVQIAQQILSAAGPALTQIAESLGQLLAAVAPLLGALGELVGNVLTALMPVLTPIISVLGQFASILAVVLAAGVKYILIPALKVLTQLLRGDFSGAWQTAKDNSQKVGTFLRYLFLQLGKWAAEGVAKVVSWLAGLPGRALAAVKPLSQRIAAAMLDAWDRAVSATKSGIASVLSWMRSLPGKAKTALGNLGNTLKEAGKALLRGFLDGIKSMFGSVKSTLGGFTDDLTSWKGPPPRDARILQPAGRLVMSGFVDGITSAMPQVRAALRAVTDEVSAYRPTIGAQVEADRAAMATSRPSGTAAPAVSIGTFVANQQQTPAGIARELAWLAKGRG